MSHNDIATRNLRAGLPTTWLRPATAPGINQTPIQPLVDDDPILLRSLCETLELDGHTVLSAGGGKQGIEMFGQAMRPDGQSTVSAVITDLGMPYCDGRGVAQAVKLASPQTPVILLTGWGERLLAEGEAQPNIDRILSKPPARGTQSPRGADDSSG